MRFIFTLALFVLILIGNTVAQSNRSVSQADQLAILKAEDELRFDKILAEFLESKNPELRKRAALAAGRIGDEDAIPALSKLLAENDPDMQQIAAFAIGEIQSLDGALAVRVAISKRNFSAKAKAVEALGKIAAANPKEEVSKKFGAAILDILELEAAKRSSPDADVILLGLTAALRAKPEGAAEVIVKFLNYSDWRVRADALNSLSRLEAKNAFKEANKLLREDKEPIVRANAARLLGASDDKAVSDLLINAATTDEDLRVRINAIRALGNLKDESSAEALLARADKLMLGYRESAFQNPVEINEILTIASALGEILKDTENNRALNFLKDFRIRTNYELPEPEIALAKIAPDGYLVFLTRSNIKQDSWKQIRSFTSGAQELLKPDENGELDKRGIETQKFLQALLNVVNAETTKQDLTMAMPDILNAFARSKPNDLKNVLLRFLDNKDFTVRAAAAGLLGDIKPDTPEDAASNYRSLTSALWNARLDDSNDVSIAILDALRKQYENRPNPMPLKVGYMTPFISAMGSPDYLIRRKAAEIYRGFDIPMPNPTTVGDPAFNPIGIPKDFGVVKFNQPEITAGKSRIVRADYKSAVFRKNGSVRAILTTEKGEFTIEFLPEEAPLTVENYIKLAKRGYFNGLEIHRVVPNFVMQDGDPRGDGNGGPGWQIRCEINQIPYERGTVGMALSGKDTGGSQWFVAHSRQPHLNGGYTVFGKVNEEGMKIVDKLVRGDKLLGIKIIEDLRNKK